jgi:hypothetical protein
MHVYNVRVGLFGSRFFRLVHPELFDKRTEWPLDLDCQLDQEAL